MTQTATDLHSYSLDPAHTSARFWVRHLMIAKVHGELSQIAGTVKYHPSSPEATEVDVTIQTASLSTGNEQRDAHLKSADFLEVERFPEIRFHSTSVRPKGAGRFEVIGDLTIRDTTREVVLDAEVSDEVASPWGGYKLGVSASATIDREEFGMTWNQALETGGVVVGREIHLQIEAELDRSE